VFGGVAFTGPVPGAGTCDAAAAFLGIATLDVGERCTAVWTITVQDLVPGQTYLNTATATGTSPLGVEVSDISDDGTVPDPDGNGTGDEDGENDPTPAVIPVVDQAVLGDKVFLDADGDGIQDADEEPIEGVVVQVFRGTELVATQETDANGLWQVALDPGDYTVTVVLPNDSFAFSPQAAGDNEALDSNVDDAGVSGTITLAAGAVNSTVDAGLVPLGSLGNRVFLDANNDGIRNANETPVRGAIVQLFEANADGTKGVLRDQQRTPADGKYLFENLPAGNYIVVVTPPTGLKIGSQDAGTDDNVDNDISPTTGESGVVSLGVGANVVNVDAGLVSVAVVRPPVVSTQAPPFAYPNITNAPGRDPVPAAPVAQAPLAMTGSSSNVLASLAIAMMAVGGTMLIGARREKDKE